MITTIYRNGLRSFLPFLFLCSSISAVIAQSENVSVASGDSLQPAALIDVAVRYPHALVVELDAGRLHVYRREPEGVFTRLKTMPISIGKEGYGKEIEGDNKTPIGVYRIVSHLNDQQLDDFYGHAAYPVNYPNAWDRLKQRTGYGIWLHAEPSAKKTRPLRDSNGCVVLSNNDIDQLSQFLDVGYTYVVLTPKMEMLSVQKVRKQREQLRARLQQWQQSWESLQTDEYLQLYSKQFNNLEKNWQQWSAYKRRVNASKRFINVNISDVGLYAYPGEKDIVWAEYYQTYRSSNYQSQGWKRQLWQLEDDGQWRIIYEGGG